MKLGLVADGLGHLKLSDCLDRIAALGLQTVEFGTGCWSEAPHLDLRLLRSNPEARARLLAEVSARGLEISALNCSGNPLHPGPTGTMHRQITRETIELANQLKVRRVVMMSGLPGAPGDSYPNWITTSWPPETQKILDWQWSQRVLPYWQELAPFATARGVRLCLEQHGQQFVYNTETFFRLRDEIGPVIGVNFDPSHLMWMGGDPVSAIRALGNTIYHVHGKDTRIEPKAKIDGLIDTKPVTPIGPRSWNYVSLGHGHSQRDWAAILSALHEVGYDDTISIENEDHLLNPETAIATSVEVLKFAIGQLPA